MKQIIDTYSIQFNKDNQTGTAGGTNDGSDNVGVSFSIIFLTVSCLAVWDSELMSEY